MKVSHSWNTGIVEFCWSSAAKVRTGLYQKHIDTVCKSIDTKLVTCFLALSYPLRSGKMRLTILGIASSICPFKFSSIAINNFKATTPSYLWELPLLISMTLFKKLNISPILVDPLSLPTPLKNVFGSLAIKFYRDTEIYAKYSWPKPPSTSFSSPTIINNNYGYSFHSLSEIDPVVE